MDSWSRLSLPLAFGQAEIASPSVESTEFNGLATFRGGHDAADHTDVPAAHFTVDAVGRALADGTALALGWRQGRIGHFHRALREPIPGIGLIFQVAWNRSVWFPVGADSSSSIAARFSTAMDALEDFTKIESIFVRHRNALLLRGQFTPIYTDYYLHLMQHGIRHSAELDQMLKDTLAMLTLHLVARPWSETIAWTINLRAPRMNLFVTGGSMEEAITGRIFTEDVREPDRNFFYSQTTEAGLIAPRTSTLEVEGRDPVAWISQFYDQSEQRPARGFRLDDENFALIAAQPDCDMAWFEALDENSVPKIDTTEETMVLETRRFRFHCGCTLEKILPIIGNWKDRLDDLFEDSDFIRIQCPRCAARYKVTRDMIH